MLTIYLYTVDGTGRHFGCVYKGKYALTRLISSGTRARGGDWDWAGGWRGRRTASRDG